ncbi:Pr6Pr family membrane protein [Propionicicella superfundia]|uniref:Pr6Pr family membrane protein n=1 Tax=Propionicicella superfundia TaxID=348582 RepID=UPI0003F5D00D|nr:Pr6Pr family membrane protein [Propionicicella superfundia]
MSPASVSAVRFGLRAAIVAGAGLGLALMLGVASGGLAVSQLAFYTIQSNILVFACYLAILIRTVFLWISQRRIALAGDPPALAMGAVMLAILVTGLVYNLILAPGLPDLSAHGVDPLGNLLVHLVTPALVFADWLFFADTEDLRWWAPFTWAAIPLAYVVFAMVRAEVGGPILPDSRYPYFFLDVDRYGAPQVLLNVAGLVVFFLVIAYLAIGLGRGLHRLTRSLPQRASSSSR